MTIAIDQHVEFRKFKYFPLDPNYVSESIIAETSFQEAVKTIKKELLNLSQRLNNSVPFFNFRSQVRKTDVGRLVLVDYRVTCCGIQP